MYTLHLSGKIPKIRIASIFVLTYFCVIHSSPNLTRIVVMNRYVPQSHRKPKNPHIHHMDIIHATDTLL